MSCIMCEKVQVMVDSPHEWYGVRLKNNLRKRKQIWSKECTTSNDCPQKKEGIHIFCNGFCLNDNINQDLKEEKWF